MKWYNAFDVMPKNPNFFLVAVRECGDLGASRYVTMAHLDNDGQFYWRDCDIKQLNGGDFYVIAWAEMPDFPRHLEDEQ
jgi:hypothetical protein